MTEITSLTVAEPDTVHTHPAFLLLGTSLALLSLPRGIWVHLGHSPRTRLTSLWIGAGMLVVQLVPGRALEASGWRSLRCPSVLAGLESGHLLPQHPPGPPHASPQHLGGGSVHWYFPSKGPSALFWWLQGFKGEILAWSGIWTKPGFNYPALSPSAERAMNRACGSWLCLSPAAPTPFKQPRL